MRTLRTSHLEYESLIEDIKNKKGDYFVLNIKRVMEIEKEINDLIVENNQLKTKIQIFSK